MPCVEVRILLTRRRCHVFSQPIVSQRAGRYRGHDCPVWCGALFVAERARAKLLIANPGTAFCAIIRKDIEMNDRLGKHRSSSASWSRYASGGIAVRRVSQHEDDRLRYISCQSSARVALGRLRRSWKAHTTVTDPLTELRHDRLIKIGL